MYRGLTKIPFDRFFELKNNQGTRGHPLNKRASIEISEE